MESPKSAWKKPERQLWKELPLSQKIISIVLATICICCAVVLTVYYILKDTKSSLDSIWLWLSLGAFIVTLTITIIYAHLIVNKAIMRRQMEEQKTSLSKEELD